MKKLLTFLSLFVLVVAAVLPINSVHANETLELAGVPRLNQYTDNSSCNTGGGNNGCAITSIAMVFQYYGVFQATPNKVYQANGNNCLAYWGGLNLSILGAPANITYEYMGDTSFAAIKSKIQQGYPVIIGNANMFGFGQHWVTVIGYTGTNFIINDPADGQRKVLAGNMAEQARLYKGTAANSQHLTGDYDGDGISDFAVYDSANSRFYFRYSQTGTDDDIEFGWPGARPISGGDYDGDGKTDLAVYNPADSRFYIRRSLDGVDYNVQYGWAGVKPLMGNDYDNDGKTDLAVYDAVNSHFYYRRSGDGVDKNKQFGWNGVIPVIAGDYNGGGKDDLAVYDPVSSTFYFKYIETNTDGSAQYGWAGVDPIMGGDYDGDGQTDLAVYDRVNSRFYYRKSQTGTDANTQFGWAGVLPIIGADYDEDGITDLAVYDRLNSHYYFRKSDGAVDDNDQFGWTGVTPL